MAFPENELIWQAFNLSRTDGGTLPSIESALNLLGVTGPAQRLRFTRIIHALMTDLREWQGRQNDGK